MVHTRAFRRAGPLVIAVGIAATWIAAHDLCEARAAGPIGAVAAAAGAPVNKKKKKAPPLDGTTYDYAYDGKDIGHPERAWHGRAFVPSRSAADPKKALPIVVFLHGLNREKIKHRWMGGGSEGDVRRIVGDLVEQGKIQPILLAAPSTVKPVNAAVAETSWMAFDLDAFLDRTEKALQGIATIDRTKVIVAGHSGAGCNKRGGIFSAMKSKHAHAILSIDTCMLLDHATMLAKTRPDQHVVVSWQSVTWGERALKPYREIFERDVKASPANAGVLRALDFMVPKEPAAHDAMVGLTLKKWLPQIVPPAAASAAPAAASAAPATSAAPPSASTSTTLGESTTTSTASPSLSGTTSAVPANSSPTTSSAP